MQAITQINAAFPGSGSASAPSPDPAASSVSVRAGAPGESTPVRPQNAAAPQPDVQDVRRAVNRANKQIAGQNEGIKFGFSEATGQLFVQVVDKDSGEVIRQIPSREFLAAEAAARNIAQSATGLILNRHG